MKAVFLTKNKNSCESVYTPETRARLAEKLEFLEPVYTTEALAEREDELRDVEIIFSTWGMFSLSSEEIARYFPKIRAVFYGAGSVQYFARSFIEAGIEVFSAWAANAVPVAEFTVAQIILANRATSSDSTAPQTTAGSIARPAATSPETTTTRSVSSESA